MCGLLFQRNPRPLPCNLIWDDPSCASPHTIIYLDLIWYIGAPSRRLSASELMNNGYSMPNRTWEVNAQDSPASPPRWSLASWGCFRNMDLRIGLVSLIHTYYQYLAVGTYPSTYLCRYLGRYIRRRVHRRQLSRKDSSLRKPPNHQKWPRIRESYVLLYCLFPVSSSQYPVSPYIICTTQYAVKSNKRRGKWRWRRESPRISKDLPGVNIWTWPTWKAKIHFHIHKHWITTLDWSNHGYYRQVAGTCNAPSHLPCCFISSTKLTITSTT